MVNNTSARPGRFSSWSWSNPRTRAWVYQAILVLLVGGVAAYLVSNTLANLQARNISSGFGFLDQEAGFAIGESVVDYQPSDSYARAIWAGLLNTLKVSVIGIVLSTVLGGIVGIARLSANWLLARLAAVYVEIFRNIPLLLQLFFWYALITETMPGPRQAHALLPGVFLSNRGLHLATLQGNSVDGIFAGLGLAIVASLALAHVARRRRRASNGRFLAKPRFPLAYMIPGLLLLMPTAGWVLGGASLSFDVPVLKGFNFAGGATLSPEFTALLTGLVLYTAAFTAEVVRSGIQSVPAGQWEAASALGLSRSLVLRLVVLPQALRVIVPPMTSQYLNLTKNSSLAIAIGYPDLVSVVNTTLNQTGQAIEGVLIIMAAYLTISLSISIFMNLYNKRIAQAGA